jgi:hypothetical protein
MTARRKIASTRVPGIWRTQRRAPCHLDPYLLDGACPRSADRELLVSPAVFTTDPFLKAVALP